MAGASKNGRPVGGPPQAGPDEAWEKGRNGLDLLQQASPSAGPLADRATNHRVTLVEVLHLRQGAMVTDQ